ncbi:MAG: PASTA domain-containing protein [Oscillospiraceae bacterium]|nr:PASTA domain-containing protein [Oscillospiraceae bacterium]
MGDTKLCFGCFEPVNDEPRCPHCGYKQQSPYSPSYIAPGTILKEKYMVGKLISHNGEGATYLAYDTVISCKVILKEYMPDVLCSRNTETQSVVVNPGSNVQYKSLMEEFTELNKKLAKLRTIDHIQQVLDLFCENNTTYVVFEYIEGQNLMQYLKENGGSLSWKAVQKLFPPLFTSLSQLHNAGIVHRGISPNTIYVTSKGGLKLTDFCIASARTNNAELTPELFKGYAAPEQYSPSVWQGTWTDVYGISSVLYRILTGCMPTEASLRSESDDLTPPSSLNCDIPDNVSEAIINGMKVAGDERIQSINDFVTLTFRPSDEDRTKTTVNIGNIASKNAREAIQKRRILEAENERAERSEAAPQRQRMIRPAPEREEYEEEINIVEKIRPAALTAMLLIVVVAFIFFLFKQINLGKVANRNGLAANLPSFTTAAETTVPETTTAAKENNGFYLTNVPPATLAPATQATEPDGTAVTTETAKEGANIQMANLVGKIYDEIKTSTLAQDVTFELKYEYREDKQRGEILEQSIKEGTWITSGEVVTLTICKGDGSTVVPDYKRGPMSCYPIQEFLSILDEEGIQYKAIPEVNQGYLSGYVIGTEPKAGTVIDSLSGDVVIVHYTENSGGGSIIQSPGYSEPSAAQTEPAN